MEKFNFKKKFGQNFLKDENIINKIVQVADITNKDLVLEVGPGKGVLTKKLALVSKKVMSYEIDKDLISYLEEIKNSNNNINFIYDDFMKRDISADISNCNFNNLFFVSNVPYYITTPILMKLIDSKLDFHKIVMMVQKEVGERFSAREGNKEYSSISVFLNYFYNVKLEFVVNRRNFIPVPNVDSVVVSLTKKEKLLHVNNYDVFFKIVKDSFKFKRKNIKNNLFSYDLDKIKVVLEKNGFSLNSRAEELPVKVFVEIANFIG